MSTALPLEPLPRTVNFIKWNADANVAKQPLAHAGGSAF
jgi:hypothetical protein